MLYAKHQYPKQQLKINVEQKTTEQKKSQEKSEKLPTQIQIQQVNLQPEKKQQQVVNPFQSIFNSKSSLPIKSGTTQNQISSLFETNKLSLPLKQLNKKLEL